MITAGTTTNSVVAYDSTLGARGLVMAQAVLGAFEGDLQTLSYLFAVFPPASLPFQINIVSGPGGGNSDGDKVVNCTVPSTFIPANLPALVVAEVAEIFMVVQNKGWIAGWSNGEARSRVSAQILYPSLRFLWSTGRSWLNGDPSSTTPARSGWVDNVAHTDQDNVTTGCGSLFLNYLGYQLGIPWAKIIQAGAPTSSTLKETASSLGLSATTAFSDFLTLLETYFPSPHQPTSPTTIPSRLVGRACTCVTTSPTMAPTRPVRLRTAPTSSCGTTSWPRHKLPSRPRPPLPATPRATRMSLVTMTTYAYGTAARTRPK
jgi:hypothetical protein